MSCVKMDCQTAARKRAAGMELPMMSRKICSNARWIWRKQAKVWRDRGAGASDTVDLEEAASRQELLIETPASAPALRGPNAASKKRG